MPLEAVTLISDFIITNPAGGDSQFEGDDHIRNIKKAIKNTFPNVSSVLNPTGAEFNHIVGVTSPIQTQINNITAGVATYATLAGTDTYTATLAPAITSYTVGAVYRLLNINANIGAAPTIAFNGLAARIVTKLGGRPLVTGDMPANDVVEVIVTSAGMSLVNPAFGSAETGDLRPTYRATTATGWILMADGTVGNASSSGTQRANADTVELFKFLWANLLDVYAGVRNTVTMTIASPCVVTSTAHGYNDDAPIRFATTGTLPTGVVAGTTYYVRATNKAANTFEFSATPGGAAINTSGTQSGTQSISGRGATSALDYAANKTIDLPKTAGRVLGGAGTGLSLTTRGLGESLGAETHVMTTAEMPSHTHSRSDGSINAGNTDRYVSGQTNPASNTVTSGATGGGGAHNNMQPTSFLNMLIKL